VLFYSGAANIDSAKQNLANTYVNAFVNMGSGKDSLMLQKKESEAAWIFKVKQEGLIAATASLGLIFQFDPENGAIANSEYTELEDGFARMGANFAIGLYS
jgi:26S proteasome regulatory subunit N1